MCLYCHEVYLEDDDVVFVEKLQYYFGNLPQYITTQLGTYDLLAKKVIDREFRLGNLQPSDLDVSALRK